MIRSHIVNTAYVNASVAIIAGAFTACIAILLLSVVGFFYMLIELLFNWQSGLALAFYGAIFLTFIGTYALLYYLGSDD